ncbi:MAG: aldo/keto reductase [Duncaniella sp.]|nr:aldo/keto reductase [Duncaniella sp.]MDE6571855.1 aldo/keto reductase [Duncaniella sp.]
MTLQPYSPSVSRYESGMNYRRCGRSGILLPEVSLGLWQNFGADRPYSLSRDIILHAFDRGVVSFDLANNYGIPYGSAEETFGRVMNDSLHPFRDELFIATKAGYDMWPGPYGNWGSRKYLTASLNQSLRRMNIDYVDLFYSHRYDPSTPLEETLQALVDIVRQGKALYVGISRWPLEAMKYAVSYLAERDTPCLVFQDKLNILDRAPIESGLTEWLVSEGCGFTSFSPLAQGLLTSRYLKGVPADSRAASGRHLKASQVTPALVEKLVALDKVAGERGETLAQMALAWVLNTPGVTSVIVGCSSMEQFDDSLGAVSSAPFTASQLERIDAIARG